MTPKASLIQVNYETAEVRLCRCRTASDERRSPPGNEGLRIGESGLGKNGARKCLCQRTDADFSSRSICLRRLDGILLLAHTAVREAEVAIHSIIGKKDTMSYRAIPGVVYTNPEIAGVGETEESLQKRGVAYRAVKFPMAYSGRFVAENEGVNGVCKLLLGSDDTVLGAHVWAIPLRKSSRWQAWLLN